MSNVGLYRLLASFLDSLAGNPYLKAIRNSLTLSLPLVMAGCFAVLAANFPLNIYRQGMERLFGAEWRGMMISVYDATFSILSLVMLLTISYSLAEHFNDTDRRRDMHPAIASLVSLASLIAILRPYPLAEVAGGPPAGMGMPLIWLGIHGLFMSIFVAFASSMIFLRLRRVKWLNISFYTDEADPTISYAFAALLPGAITIMLFALLETILTWLGVRDIHQYLLDLLSLPFSHLDNTLGTALLYNFCRHFFWFFGIHGSNLLEPITASIYVPAMAANEAAAMAGEAAPYIFTKSFFDAFISMGGSGATLSLIIACLIHDRRGSMSKIAQISALPALFNINEMIMFGLPVVLNPVFLIPFLTAPLVLTVTGYLATAWGLVPATATPIDWTAPVLLGGYAATGSYAGAALQVFHIILSGLIYYPFVRMAAEYRHASFKRAFQELMPGYAQSIGKADYQVTSEARALSRSLVNDLADAATRKELFLEYQPQVESLTGKVFGVEALMRWKHPRLGRIPPGLFITLAEEAGLIKMLGSWALEEACRQLVSWRRMGIADVAVSVNVSVNQLDDGSILEEIKHLVRTYEISPGALEVEVTESVTLDGGAGKAELLHAISELGVGLAIDDFGMGHSSLVYLKHFPVGTLKIDRALSKDVVSSRLSSEIVFSISELCHSLKIHPLAEFVDDVAQLKTLQTLGCTRIQGYLYSPPLPPDLCADFIRKGAKVY